MPLFRDSIVSGDFEINGHDFSDDYVVRNYTFAELGLLSRVQAFQGPTEAELAPADPSDPDSGPTVQRPLSRPYRSPYMNGAFDILSF
jgi:hypothetical protein